MEPTLGKKKGGGPCLTMPRIIALVNGMSMAAADEENSIIARSQSNRSPACCLLGCTSHTRHLDRSMKLQPWAKAWLDMDMNRIQTCLNTTLFGNVVVLDPRTPAPCLGFPACVNMIDVALKSPNRAALAVYSCLANKPSGRATLLSSIDMIHSCVGPRYGVLGSWHRGLDHVLVSCAMCENELDMSAVYHFYKAFRRCNPASPGTPGYVPGFWRILMLKIAKKHTEITATWYWNIIVACIDDISKSDGDICRSVWAIRSFIAFLKTLSPSATDDATITPKELAINENLIRRLMNILNK